MNKPILKYGKFTEKKTKNIIGPEYKDVFADYSKLNTDYFLFFQFFLNIFF